MAMVRRLVGLVVLVYLCSVVLLGCQTAYLPRGETARVSRVVSGQTLEVVMPQQSNQIQRVRLIGVSAPAWKQEPWFSQAQQYMSDRLSPGTSLVLETDRQPTVTYGDGTMVHLAYIWQEGQLLNEQLVAAGWALAEERSPNVKYRDRLFNAQEKARLTGVGLWNPAQPMRQTPAEFAP